MHVMFLTESTDSELSRLKRFWDKFRFKTSKSSSDQAKLYEYRLMSLRFPEEKHDDILKIMAEKFGLRDKSDKLKFNLVKKMLNMALPKLKDDDLSKIRREKGNQEKITRCILIGKIEDKYINGTEQI